MAQGGSESNHTQRCDEKEQESSEVPRVLGEVRIPYQIAQLCRTVPILWSGLWRCEVFNCVVAETNVRATRSLCRAQFILSDIGVFEFVNVEGGNDLFANRGVRLTVSALATFVPFFSNQTATPPAVPVRLTLPVSLYAAATSGSGGTATRGPASTMIFAIALASRPSPS